MLYEVITVTCFAIGPAFDGGLCKEILGNVMMTPLPEWSLGHCYDIVIPDGLKHFKRHLLLRGFGGVGCQILQNAQTVRRFKRGVITKMVFQIRP